MSPVDLESEKKELERLMQAWVQADNDKDVDKQMAFCDFDVIAHMPFTPEVRGLEANRELRKICD